MDLRLRPTVGLDPGETIQFALGRWPDGVGIGLALSEEAFDAIEPTLHNVWPEWDSGGRYGVTELAPSVTSALALELRTRAADMRSSQRPSGEAELFSQLADWLEAHGKQPVSILGM